MKRLHLFLAAAALLLLLNILKWGSSDNTHEQEADVSMVAQDFVLYVPIDDPMPTDNRDLFYTNFQKTSLNRQTVRRQIHRPAPVVKAPPLPKPVEQEILKETAQPPITLVGTAFRKDVRFAYIIRDNERYSVGVGEKIGQDFVVQQIDSDWVTIKNIQTGSVFDLHLTGGGQ